MRFTSIALAISSGIIGLPVLAQSSGTAPQAGVAGPADAKGGSTKTMPGKGSAPAASGSMGTSKGSSTGGNAGGTENRN